MKKASPALPCMFPSAVLVFLFDLALFLLNAVAIRSVHAWLAAARWQHRLMQPNPATALTLDPMSRILPRNWARRIPRPARVFRIPGRAEENFARKSTMYAVIKTGGKQYRVAAEDVLKVEKVAGDAGSTVEFTEVLMLAGSGDPKVGKPLLSGAKVTAEVVEQGRGPKLIAFKKRRRKNSRRKRGHRQELTTIRIKEIIGA
jgi:large subunit ribosomal protein L21